MSKIDVRIQRHGLSIVMMRAVSRRGRRWMDRFLLDSLYLGDAVAVDVRYSENIIQGMQNAGLRVGAE